MGFDKAEYQRQYMARKRLESNKESNISEVVLDKMLDNPVRQVDGPHTHTCPDCNKVWNCRFVQDGICWRDDRCYQHTPVPELVSLYTATPEQWSTAYTRIQEAKDNAPKQ